MVNLTAVARGRLETADPRHGADRIWQAEADFG